MFLFLNMSGGEIFVIVLFILLFFGSKQIPDIARGLGRGIREFKNATGELQRELDKSIHEIDKIKKDIDPTKDFNL
jgi:sec-independent protein translocase protein TatA